MVVVSDCDSDSYSNDTSVIQYDTKVTSFAALIEYA
jgi:hypothetical protein